MNCIEVEILNRIRELDVECPECEVNFDKVNVEQCVTCGCEGGDNYINALTYIKQHGLENIKETILDEIRILKIECPECESMYSDDQYTCTTCWCEGGGGRINVLEYLKENKNLLS